MVLITLIEEEKIMLAERLYLTADERGHLHNLPTFAPFEYVEVVFLHPESALVNRRQLSSALQKSAEIKGDLTEAVFTDMEWAEVEAEWDEFYPKLDRQKT